MVLMKSIVTVGHGSSNLTQARMRRSNLMSKEHLFNNTISPGEALLVGRSKCVKGKQVSR